MMARTQADFFRWVHRLLNKNKTAVMMNNDNDMTRSLARTAGILSMIDGGMTMPSVSFTKKENEYLYSLRFAGADADDFNVAIDHQNLFVFYSINFNDSPVPYLLKRIVIPAEVAYGEISAEFREGRLEIAMPFNDLARGYHRDIDIIKRY